MKMMDVGFVGKWWLLEDKMKSFDISLNEWPEEDSSWKTDLFDRVNGIRTSISSLKNIFQ